MSEYTSHLRRFADKQCCTQSFSPVLSHTILGDILSLKKIWILLQQLRDHRELGKQRVRLFSFQQAFWKLLKFYLLSRKTKHSVEKRLTFLTSSYCQPCCETFCKALFPCVLSDSSQVFFLFRNEFFRRLFLSTYFCKSWQNSSLFSRWCHITQVRLCSVGGRTQAGWDLPGTLISSPSTPLHRSQHNPCPTHEEPRIWRHKPNTLLSGVSV